MIPLFLLEVFMDKKSLGDIESAFAFFRETKSDEELSRQTVFLKYCGIERCLPGHGYGPAKRDCFLIHFILDGHGIYEYQGEKIHLEKGQSFLIYPEEDVYYQADLASPWKYCWVAFQGEMAAGIVEELGYTHTFPVCTFMDMDSIEKGISGIISRGGRDTSDVLWREGSFLHLIANLFDQADDREIYDQDDSGGVELRLGSRMYAAQAIHYLETRFREKIQIQQLAQDIGISRSYLTQLFKEEIGMSPRELLINIRMEHATEFLEKSNDPIQLVALECGYDDALAFSKAFKQRFGMSPSRYRKEKQKAARI